MLLNINKKKLDRLLDRYEKGIAKRSLPITKSVIRPVERFFPKQRMPKWNEGFNEDFD